MEEKENEREERTGLDNIDKRMYEEPVDFKHHAKNSYLEKKNRWLDKKMR